MLYEAFYHLKCDITTRLDSLERCVRRQESMYDIVDNIDRKLAYLLPCKDTHNEAMTLPGGSFCSYRMERSLPEVVCSAPPTVTDSNVKNMDMFRSDTNLSYMRKKSRISGVHRRGRSFIDDCDISPEVQRSTITNIANRSSSEEEECVPMKLKSDILISELESKQDSGLESDSREQRSESSTSFPHNDDEDPLMELLSEIEQRALLSRKEVVLHQISAADTCLNLVHERSKISSQRDLLYERLKSANLERESCQLKVKEMRRNVSTLETDKEWLLKRLEESIAGKKQVMGKIGGMHSQFVKKGKSKPTGKIDPNPSVVEPVTKKAVAVPEVSNRDSRGDRELPKRRLQVPQQKGLSYELRLKDIVQETNVVELRRKLIKSMVKNYALQSKVEPDDSQLACRSRIKGGTFTKVKAASMYAPEIMPIKSKIPTMKPKHEFEPSLPVASASSLQAPSGGNSATELEVNSSPEGSCRTFLKTEKGESYLFQIPETHYVESHKVIPMTKTTPR